MFLLKFMVNRNKGYTGALSDNNSDLYPSPINILSWPSVIVISLSGVYPIKEVTYDQSIDPASKGSTLTGISLGITFKLFI